MKKIYYSIVFTLLLWCVQGVAENQSVKRYSLQFHDLATSWDEAMPLGNGVVGELVWMRKGILRFSLDRSDLWDLRPMASIDFTKWKFKDVYRHWQDNTYADVQKAFDQPYDTSPAPSKIPAAALEFDVGALGAIKSVVLKPDSALCRVEWENGAQLLTFVHATLPVGWYQFRHIPAGLKVRIVPPAYSHVDAEGPSDQSSSDLVRLGYKQGAVENGPDWVQYTQKGWGAFTYQVATRWQMQAGSMTGCWSVTSNYTDKNMRTTASVVARKALSGGMSTALKTHVNWWRSYWDRSEIHIPDSILESQYYMEMYKFGSVARDNALPISLQAVWTADNGKLPPWKGDFHHDLNTQLSYWPSYTGNQLALEKGFVNWLWNHRSTFKHYTHDYFQVEGLNVPGVTTSDGKPMGGWIQYAMGLTVGAWLGQHFYLHWQYSRDRTFLEHRAYPWIKDVACFFENISKTGPDGKRSLPLSSSPEIYNNSRKAWFERTSNFDLALVRWTYIKAAEMAHALGRKEDAIRWTKDLSEWPTWAVDSVSGLMFAPGFPHNESHRHLSHMLGIHPLGIIDYSNGVTDRELILKSLASMEQCGPDWWVGYSYSWAANLYARAFEGEKAAEALKIFANCFCLRNTFHVNGDQSKTGKSKFTYRPFTLEGNFAFASGVQEMLIQSHTDRIVLFPAVPSGWKDVWFHKLRTRGAFLVSAQRQAGRLNWVKVYAEKGGMLRLQNTFNGKIRCNRNYQIKNDCLEVPMKAGETVELKLM